MEASHFDALTRSLADARSRRAAVGGLLAGTLGLLRFAEAAAKQKSKNRKNRLQRNAFGCVNVGGKCRAKDSNCCSGICQGKKPKKGERDKSKCIAHNTGACSFGQDSCGGGVFPCGLPGGNCLVTTGNASFCGVQAKGACLDCKKDADCVALGYGQGAACCVCNDCSPLGVGTGCSLAAA
jgi:hypothetical protein